MSQVKVAVFGAGQWGKNIIRVFHELDCLGAICDHDSKKASFYSKEYSTQVKSWVEILKDESINAVAIVIPAEFHSKYIKEALEANKHVFIEKPLAMDTKTAHELGVLAQTKGRVLMVGHILQYHNAYLKLKDLIEAGEIGDIKYIESTRLHMGPVRYNAGIIWELLPHDVSMLLGICNQTISSISVQQQQILNDNSETSYGDVVNIHIEYSNGVLAKLKSSWIHANKEQKFWVAGSKGMLVFTDTENWDSKLKLFKYTNSNHNSTSIMFEQKIPLTPLEPLKAELSHFVSAVKNGSTVVTDAAEGARVVNLLEKIEQSISVREKTALSVS